MNVVFAMTGAAALPGGIATLNLNILPVLEELARQRGLPFQVLSYLEDDADRPDCLPKEFGFQGFAGHKAAFLQGLVRAAIERSIMIFDHVTLALPVLPFATIGWVRTVMFAHGSEAWRHVRLTSRWSFRAAVLTLANSHFTLRKMRERMPRFEGVACPLGLSPRFRLNAKIPEAIADRIELTAADGHTRPLGGQMLLMTARMHPEEPRKGHYPLLKVWPALVREFPDAQLVFAGAGENKQRLQDLARESGIASSVFLTGHIPVEFLERLYRHCYAFIMPSKQEGFGLVYLEAMNFGKPCVGCFDDGAEDVILHCETGLLVRDPNCAEDVLGVLRSLLTDSRRAREMGANGFARLHENFTSQHVQDRIKEHIGKVIPC